MFKSIVRFGLVAILCVASSACVVRGGHGGGFHFHGAVGVFGVR